MANRDICERCATSAGGGPAGTVLVVVNGTSARARDASLLLSAYLGSQGVGCVLVDASEVAMDEPVRRAAADGATEGAPSLIVALGGDGTILRAGHLAMLSGAPILGVNFGNLGFLANTGENGVVAAVAAALAGEVSVEERTVLQVDVVCEGDPDDPDDAGLPRSFHALNEVSLSRHASGRVIACAIDISGERVCSLRGDGLIAATATGSTAYALSAGGPLVAPGFRGLIVVPLAPHTLSSRALVTDPSDCVEVAIDNSRADGSPTLFVDGAAIALDGSLERIVVRRSDVIVKLLRCAGEGFFSRAGRVFF